MPNHNSNKKRYDLSNNDERHVSEIQKVVEQHLECIDRTKKTTCPIENHHLLEPTERVKKFNKEQQVSNKFLPLKIIAMKKCCMVDGQQAGGTRVFLNKKRER